MCIKNVMTVFLQLQLYQAIRYKKWHHEAIYDEIAEGSVPFRRRKRKYIWVKYWLVRLFNFWNELKNKSSHSLSLTDWDILKIQQSISIQIPLGLQKCTVCFVWCKVNWLSSWITQKILASSSFQQSECFSFILRIFMYQESI